MAASWFAFVVRNMLRRRRRLLLTVASVSVSMCLVGVLLALGRALLFGGTATPGQAERLVVHHKIALTQDLPVADERVINQLPGVRAVTSLRWLGGVYKDTRDPKNRFSQFAIEPQTFFDVYPEFDISADQKHAFMTQKTGCVASRALATQQGWGIGEHITLTGTVVPATLELTLVGIFDTPTPNPVMYFNAAYLRDSLRPGDPMRDMVQQFYVETDHGIDVERVAAQIDRAFGASPFPTKTEPEAAFLLSFVSFLGNLKLFLLVLIGAVTFTVFLIATNMLAMTVRERRREVGVLKTLGFSSSEILRLVASEAEFTAVIGGVVGSALAAWLCATIAGAMRNAPGFASVIQGFTVSPLVATLTMLTAVAIGLASSIGPGLSAARLRIVDALQDNG